MIKVRKINKMKVLFSVSLIVCICFVCVQEEKMDVMKFLENIKQIIKARMLELKARKSKRKDKSEILKQKIKIRKKLIEKLSNPFLLFRKPEHYIINVKGQKSESAGPSRKVRLPSAVVKSAGQNSKISENNLTLNKSLNPQISQSINRILKENPVLVPFKFPDLKKLISNKLLDVRQEEEEKDKVLKTNNQLLTSLDVDTLRVWYQDLLKNLFDFWDFFIKIFNNETRFAYLKRILCSEEIDESISFEGLFGYNSPFTTIGSREGIISLTRYEDVFSNLRSSNGDTYAISKNVRYMQCNRMMFGKRSLCFSLAQLSELGYCRIHRKKDYLKLLYDYITIKSKVGEIQFVLLRLYREARQYFTYAEKIYKNILLPTFIDMCYSRCLCQDLNIPCSKQSSSGPLDMKKLIILLTYSSGIFNESLKNLQDLYNTVSGNIFGKYANVNNCSSFNSQLSESLISEKTSIIDLMKNHIAQLDDEIFTLFSQNYFNVVLAKLYDKAPDVLADILNTTDFQKFLNQYTQLKNDTVAKNNRCQFLIFSYMAVELDNKDALNFLMAINQTALLWLFQYGKTYAYDMLDIECKKLDDIDKVSISETLGLDLIKAIKFLISLKYDIFRYLSLLRLNKCYGFVVPGLEGRGCKINQYIEQVERILKKFKCVFDNEQLDVLCLLENEFVKNLIREIFGGNTSLSQGLNIDRIKDKDFLYEISPTLNEQCLDKNLEVCNKFYSEGFLSRSESEGNISPEIWRGNIQYFCIKDSVSSKTGLDNLKLYCPELKLPDCKDVQTVEKPSICMQYNESNETYQLNVNDKCLVSSECFNLESKLAPVWRVAGLSSPQWLIASNPELAPKIEMKKFCEFIYESLLKCCSIITQIKSDNLENQLKIFYALPEICTYKVKDNLNFDYSSIFAVIRKHIEGRPSVLKELYMGYQNSSMCK